MLVEAAVPTMSNVLAVRWYTRTPGNIIRRMLRTDLHGCMRQYRVMRLMRLCRPSHATTLPHPKLAKTNQCNSCVRAGLSELVKFAHIVVQGVLLATSLRRFASWKTR